MMNMMGMIMMHNEWQHGERFEEDKDFVLIYVRYTKGTSGMYKYVYVLAQQVRRAVLHKVH